MGAFLGGPVLKQDRDLGKYDTSHRKFAVVRLLTQNYHRLARLVGCFDTVPCHRDRHFDGSRPAVFEH